MLILRAITRSCWWDNSLKDDPHKHIEIQPSCLHDVQKNLRKGEHEFRLVAERTMPDWLTLGIRLGFSSFSTTLFYTLQQRAHPSRQTSSHLRCNFLQSAPRCMRRWNLYFWVSWMLDVILWSFMLHRLSIELSDVFFAVQLHQVDSICSFQTW